uniref:Mitochondrial ribosomal protein S11 n=1 Tax=Myotis lucifugus TaxID=59463 RepID=G1PE42_MYOLU
MQAVRNSGSRLLWSWAWPPTNRIVARVPAATIHTGAQQLQDAAAKQKVEKAAPAPAATPAPSSSSSSPPEPGTTLQSLGTSEFPTLSLAICATLHSTRWHAVLADVRPAPRHLPCFGLFPHGGAFSLELSPCAPGAGAGGKATAKGVTHIRVVVKGLGPGRLVICIQGLTMGGLEVISITDNTPIPHNGCRPRKARRL